MNEHKKGVAMLLVGAFALVSGCGKDTRTPEPIAGVVVFPAHDVQLSIPAGWQQSSIKDIGTDVFVEQLQAHTDRYTKENPDWSCFLVCNEFPAVICLVPGKTFVTDNPAEAGSAFKRGIESGRSAASLAWLLFGRPPLHSSGEFSIRQEDVAGQSLPTSSTTGDGVVLWGVHVPKKIFGQRIAVTVGIACPPEVLPRAKSAAAHALTTITRAQKPARAPTSTSEISEADMWTKPELTRKLKDQALLASMALRAPDSAVRKAAAETLTDQLLLADVAIQAEDWDVWDIAVQALTNQEALAKVAMTAKHGNTRSAAVSKLTNQKLLAEIFMEAKNNPDRHWIVLKAGEKNLSDPDVLAKMGMWIRPEYTRQVTDQELLSEIAMWPWSSPVREAAVQMLTNQTLLAKVAVRNKAAAEKLSDPALLAEVGIWINPEATQHVTNQALLARLATNAAYRDVRSVAIGKLTDQHLLADIAAKYVNWNTAPDDHMVRSAAVAKLADQALLTQIALDDKDQTISEKAVRALTDQQSLAKVVIESKNVIVCTRAMERLTDAALIATAGVWIRSDMTRQLTDQPLLATIATKANHRGIRCAAVETLADEALLERVARETDDMKTREAARLRIAEIRNGVRSQNAERNELRDAENNAIRSIKDGETITTQSGITVQRTGNTVTFGN